MPLHERVTKNEILLPGIILCNKMLADAPKADGLIKSSESNTKLPNLQVTHASIDNNLNEEGELKNKRKPGSSKQRHEDLKKSLEFVSIVDNPPTELKFVSKTDVRGSQQASHDICTRWLEHIARSMHEQIKENEAPLMFSREQEHMQHRNSEEQVELEEHQAIFELVSMTSADVSMAKSFSEEVLLQPRANLSKNSKDLLKIPKSGRKTSAGNVSLQGPARIAVENDDVKADIFSKNSSCLKTDESSCLEFVARRMDLVKRQDVSTKKTERRSAQTRGSFEYDITVNLFKGRIYKGHNCEDASQARSQEKKKVCGRFEKRFKSAPKERITACHEDVLQANKIRLYPFYETKWNKGETGDESAKQCSKLNDKVDLSRQLRFESKKAFTRDERKNDINENLKVSSLQLTAKQRTNEYPESGKKPENREEKSAESEIKVMKILCPQKSNLEETQGDCEDFLQCGLDLYNLLTMNSTSLRETMLLLARVTASSQLLSNQQILQLIENGDINISRFLIIKKLLLAVHPFNTKTISGSFLVRPRKEILSLLNAVLEFIDRCEKILKQEKRASFLEALNDFDTGIDCIERGVVVGKMPSISVTGYNQGCKNSQTVVDDVASHKEKKKRINLLRSKKLRIKRENTEEYLERKAISIASLRRSILVNAMDLATNNGWRRSYLLRRRYLPKKKKMKSLCLTGFKHVNTFTVKKNSQKIHNRECHPLDTTPPSRSSVSTSFDSGELHDYHVSKEKSVLHELQANGDDNQEHCETQAHDSQNADVEKESGENLLRKQRRRSRGTKVCEFLKGRISSKLQKNFDLYPKIQRLMSSLHDKTESKDDIKASRDAKTDYISHFKLIEPNRYEMYCKAFAKMDKEDKGWISPDMVRMTVRFVDSVASCSTKFIEYALTVLDALLVPKITLKMFCVICGVLEKMLEGGAVISDAVGALNLLMSEGKIFWYKSMFYDSSELDKNFVGLETVKLELFAGGIGKEEEQQISEKIVDKDSNKISYLDFIAYIPLFIAIHDKICANAFE
ncbi:uncharacterized protein LOC135686927 isoform X2 [Rhopilema esculentum]|uniref:uncharacterized protein LOC135686927 isoform X2 n=1 Tax=Rhopilema esculentum TaxID=499914 RepID=UPI0031D76327